jgi:hypothetical protein
MAVLPSLERDTLAMLLAKQARGDLVSRRGSRRGWFQYADGFSARLCSAVIDPELIERQVEVVLSGSHSHLFLFGCLSSSSLEHLRRE